MSLRASVVLCTRNRAAHLEDALQSLRAQCVDPSLAWEVIVVDNASEDETPGVVAAKAAAAGVAIRYVREPELGLSVARNRGWREARGEIVAYLDDDAVADPRWLHELLRAYAAPHVAGVGGKLLPMREDDALHPVDPAWLRVYTFDLGDQERSVPVLSGANMSYRRERLERIGGFDRQLGRAGGCLLAGDENDVCDAILRSSRALRLVYAPHAIVRHKVVPAQLSDEILIKRSYCGGISNVRIDRKAGAAQRALRLLRRYLKFALWGLRRLARRGLGLRGEDLGQRARMQEFIGYHRELRHGPQRACQGCPMFPYRAPRLPPAR